MKGDARPMNGKKVLIIDDNPVVIRLNEAFLKAAGYETLQAQNGKEGLLKAREERPDVILLDIILPEIHGFELSQKLQEDPQTRDIPIIFITGAGLEDVVMNEQSLNVVACLRKPYNADELNAAVSKALS